MTSKKLPELLTMIIPVPVMIVGFLFVLWGFVGAGKTQKQTTISTVDSVTGERAYLAYCSTCHGVDAKGIPGLGKDLIASEFVHNTSNAELRDFIIKGRPMWDVENTSGIEMPPRGGNPNLTDAEIDAIILFLREGK